MRRFLIAVALATLCSASSWADSILDVNAWATFTANNCSSNCATETIQVNFLYQPPPNPFTLQDPLGTIVANSLTLSASGVLGTFTAPFPEIASQGYIPFFSSAGLSGCPFADTCKDEIDLNVNGPLGVGIAPGSNTVSFVLFSCATNGDTNCQSNFIGADPHHSPSSEGSTAVAVPDGTSFLPMSIASIGSFALAWRWRRKNVINVSPH